MCSISAPVTPSFCARVIARARAGEQFDFKCGDLSAMTDSRVDPLARTIQLRGGCLNANLDRESQTFGLAATGGIVSHTGIGASHWAEATVT